MKLSVTTAALLILTTGAEAQAFLGTPSDRIRLHEMQRAEVLAETTPDYGYLVYDQSGKVVKAFGPQTPITMDANGRLQIPGASLPEGAVLRTEDGPTYVNAVAGLFTDDPDQSAYTEKIRDMVTSVSESATYVRDTLCPHPARPSAIQVEIEGGFSVGVHAGFKSTVDWDLDKICTTGASATGQ